MAASGLNTAANTVQVVYSAKKLTVLNPVNDLIGARNSDNTVFTARSESQKCGNKLAKCVTLSTAVMTDDTSSYETRDCASCVRKGAHTTSRKIVEKSYESRDRRSRTLLVASTSWCRTYVTAAQASTRHLTAA